MVKAGLAFHLLPECEANFSEKYARPLVAAVVNAVFSEAPSNEAGQKFLAEAANQANVNIVIEKAIKPQLKLKQILTDAVRVKCTLAYAASREMSEAEFLRLCKSPIENLKRLGLLVPGGDEPKLSVFLRNAATFLAACQADLQLHRSRGGDQE